MIRGISGSVAAALVLAVSASGAFAQQPLETPAEACSAPDTLRVLRAVKLALDPAGLAPSNGQLIIAIVEPSGARDLEQGTPVKIIQVLAGKFPGAAAVADKQPTLACLSDGVWIQGRQVIGVFLASGETLTTIVAVPYVNGSAVIGDETLTVDQLLERGRSFVEATPTPLPPGIPPPPAVVPPNAGIELPAAGGIESGGTSGWLYAVIAAVALVSFGGAVLLLRRGKG